MAGLGKIVGEMKKLGIAISTGTIKAILRRHNITPPNDRQYTVTGSWRKFVANVDSLVACDFLTKVRQMYPVAHERKEETKYGRYLISNIARS